MDKYKFAKITADDFKSLYKVMDKIMLGSISLKEQVG